MVKISDFTFPSTDGVHQIYNRQWLPDGPVRAVVQLVHGVAEHIGRYEDFGSFLAEHGLAAVGDDHLGHGRTAAGPEELGWFSDERGWEHLVEDEKRLRDILRERYPAAKLVLLGHSMGSFISRTYLGWHPGDHDLCVLSGTGHQPGPVCAAGKLAARAETALHGSRYRSPLLQKLAFGSYLKKIDDPIGPNDWICRDEAVIRRYGEDPFCAFTATAGLMYDMMDGLSLIRRPSHLAKMDKSLPVLFIAGDADPVGAYGKGVEKTAAAFRKAGMTDVTVKLYPQFRHEVLNELGREQVWDDVLRWIEEKLK